MDIDLKLTILDRMVEIYDDFVGAYDLACDKYCAHCCTANVTMTTLEGYRIYSHLEQTGGLNCLASLDRLIHPDRFIPRVSINRMADICARDGDPPDENPDPTAGPCPMLEKDLCNLYPVRPFACRCMVSSRNCGKTGFADMDPFILTVNDIFLQHIEHIDAHGYTGNFSDVIQFLAVDQNRQRYVAGQMETPPAGLVANQPVFVLMIPPEHRERVQSLLTQIRSIRV